MAMHNERGEKGQGHEPRVSVLNGQIGKVIGSRGHCHDHVKGSNWQGHPISGLLFFNQWGQKKGQSQGQSHFVTFKVIVLIINECFILIVHSQ